MIGMVDKMMDKAARAILSGEIDTSDFAYAVGQDLLPVEQQVIISLAWATARKAERSL